MTKSEGQPTSANRDRISGNEESAENTKKQLADALVAEDYAKVAELGGKMKSLKGQKEEFMDKDYEEALAENTERKDYDEAKNEDTEREQVKAKEKAEASGNLKKQIAEAMATENYAKVAELGGQMKELMAEPKEKKVDAMQTKKELEELSRKNREDSDKKAEEISKKLKEKMGDESLQRPEVAGKTREVQQYIDKMPVKDGMYMGNFLSGCPKELMGNEQFLLKVAEVNPAAAYDHATGDLKKNKEFILKLIKSQPRPETDKVNYHRVDFYSIEKTAPDLLKDKDLAKAVAENGGYGSMRADVLQDKEIYEVVAQMEMDKIIENAKNVAKRNSGGYVNIATFKAGEDGTLGGVRAKVFENDKVFMDSVKKAVGEYVDVSVRNGQLYFEPKK